MIYRRVWWDPYAGGFITEVQVGSLALFARDRRPSLKFVAVGSLNFSRLPQIWHFPAEPERTGERRGSCRSHGMLLLRRPDRRRLLRPENYGSNFQKDTKLMTLAW